MLINLLMVINNNWKVNIKKNTHMQLAVEPILPLKTWTYPMNKRIN